MHIIVGWKNVLTERRMRHDDQLLWEQKPESREEIEEEEEEERMAKSIEAHNIWTHNPTYT